jgi:glycerate kinase
VANAIKKGVKLALPDAQLIVVPVADGGEGTLSAYLNALGGQMRESQVNGPDSNFVTARWGIVNSGSTAVIETYEAIGITKVRQPTPVLCELSSEGVGQLILEALDLGIRDFIVTIGGTATNDAGYGLLNEIGFRFLGSDATPVAHGACSLEMIAKIDSSSRSIAEPITTERSYWRRPRALGKRISQFRSAGPDFLGNRSINDTDGWVWWWDIWRNDGIFGCISRIGH